VDATSKIPSGLWSLSFGEMGDFEQCINVEATTRVGAILGKYCLGYLVVKNTFALPNCQRSEPSTDQWCHSNHVHRIVPSLTISIYRSTRTAWLVTQWTEVPPTSGAHFFVVSGSVQIVYNRAKISASSFK
jgi:hypothetical protein